MKRYCLELTGDFACFTRPEMKVERVSYDVMTPSAARACFEAILWKPAIRWHIRRIEVLKPIRWINLRRNEVASVVSTRNVETAMKNGTGILGLNIEDDRQQRAGLFLRDVAYRVHADLEFLTEHDSSAHANKYFEMFERRASRGQCVNQPYLGCREFPSYFRLIEPGEPPESPFPLDQDLGWILYDVFDLSRPGTPHDSPDVSLFCAVVRKGVLDVPEYESPKVRKPPKEVRPCSTI